MTFKELLTKNSYMESGDILKYINVVIPTGDHEYDFYKSICAITDYGRWMKDNEAKIRAANNDGEVIKILQEYFRNQFLESRSHQSCKFIKDDQCAKEIHVLLGKQGYQFQCYFGEGKRLTTKDKIENLKKELQPSTIQEIEKHFDGNNLVKILKGRKDIKTVRPKNDGINYYIWRLTRFNLGIDPTMPVMADLELRIYLKENIQDDIKKAYELVDLLVFQMNKEVFKEKAYSGVEIWGRALGYTI